MAGKTEVKTEQAEDLSTIYTFEGKYIGSCKWHLFPHLFDEYFKTYVFSKMLLQSVTKLNVV